MVILFLWVCSSTSQRQHPAEYPSRAARSSTLQTHRLPRIGNLFRTDFRFAPSPRSASLAGPPIHEGHGRPRSVRKSSRLRVKMPVHLIAAAQTDANLSAHLHRLPTPPPYLRRMRLSPGWGASIRWVIRLLPGRMHRSCKSPRARIPVLGTSRAHWPARWPRFELTERVDKS